MKINIKGFITSKKSELYSDCADNYAINIEHNKFSISDIISYLFFFKGLENINIGHLWFINTLLILYIIFPLLKACYDTEWGKKYLLILMISCFLIFGFLNDLDMLLKWLGLDLGIIYLYYFLPFKTNGIMLGFFILGGLVASDEFEEAIIKFDRLKIKIFAFILSLIGIIGMFLTKYHFDGTFKWNGNYLNDGYCRFTTTLVAVGIFFLFYKAELRLKSTKRIVTIISESTLATFYIHYFLGLALTVTYEIERSGVLFNSLKSLLFILISIIIALPMKKIPCLRKLV